MLFRSLLADEQFHKGAIAGLLCLGYPFHPPAKPAQLRIAHLHDMKTPALICQGTRDPFGMRDEITGLALSPSIEIHWLEDGDHDLKPRKSITGLSATNHLQTMAISAAKWIDRIAPARVTNAESER